MSEFQRARRPEQKQQRRDAILAAARRLAAESGVAHVTLSGVAAAVGQAKSNVGRYFGTREEIYLELAAQCWHDWRDEVLRRLDDGDNPVDTLAETLADRPLFCDLLCHASTSLEHNVSITVASDYKRIMVAAIGELGTAAARAHPTLTAGEGVELVTTAIGLVSALYPAANPPASLAEIYLQYPELAAARPRLLETMKRLLAAVAAGLPTLRGL
jgi:AcrR family transcriptional regulator